MTKNTSSTQEIKGDISIHTENILPIIKKWLYSENEIFIRELVSNAFDAISKRQKIASMEGIDCPENPGIKLSIDEKEKTITISDDGIGMTSKDIQKYINQIAFSGAEDFIKKYKDTDEKNPIIGHFGLGFYSAFIVSDKVDIQSLSYQKDASPVHWSCDGSTQFSIKAGSRTTVGTDIILYLNDESDDYLKPATIKSLVRKYANFLPIEIKVGDDIVNDQNPLWVKEPSSLSDDDYKAFYKKLFPYSQDPLFWIHLNVDYPFNLKGILYFPKVTSEMELNKGQIQLFCQQVFVTDNAKDVVPEFLTLLKGNIDCPDIPLNVSRSYLQNDPYVKKISTHIVKKVSDKLKQIFKKDRESFEKYWEDIHYFIKYGLMTDDSFYSKTNEIILFNSSENKATTIQEYLDRNKEKLEKKVLYCSDKDTQRSYVDLFKSQGLEVIFTHTLVDSQFLQFLEAKLDGVSFVPVDAEISDHLIDQNDDAEVVDPDTKKSASDDTVELFKSILQKESLTIKSEKLKSDHIPAMILQSQEARRMKEMSAMLNQSGNLPGMDDYTLVINQTHPVIESISKLAQSENGHKTVEPLIQQIYDLAMLNQKPLSGDEMNEFIQRSNKLLVQLTQALNK